PIPRHNLCPNPDLVKLYETSYINVPLRENTTVAPSLKGCAGMIPTFITWGTMTPGVLGPTILASFVFAYSNTFIESIIGTCSGTATTNFIPLSRASLAALRKKGAGTNIPDIFAPVDLTASAILSNTGIPSKVWLPLPGVTPATILVP